MNAPLRLKDNEASGWSDNIVPILTNFQSSSRPNLIRRMLRALVAFIASPNGDQGGWEAGARGL